MKTRNIDRVPNQVSPEKLCELFTRNEEGRVGINLYKFRFRRTIRLVRLLRRYVKGISIREDLNWTVAISMNCRLNPSNCTYRRGIMK